MVASNSKAHLVLSKNRKKCLLLTFHNLLSHDTRHYRIILLHHQNSFKTVSCAQDFVVGGIWKATTTRKMLMLQYVLASKREHTLWLGIIVTIKRGGKYLYGLFYGPFQLYTIIFNVLTCLTKMIRWYQLTKW